MFSIGRHMTSDHAQSRRRGIRMLILCRRIRRRLMSRRLNMRVASIEAIADDIKSRRRKRRRHRRPWRNPPLGGSASALNVTRGESVGGAASREKPQAGACAVKNGRR